MMVLRDRKGWQLADTLIRQAARDTNGTVQSLATRFLQAGVPQPATVLAQLVQLRAEAVQAGDGAATAGATDPGDPADGRPANWQPPAWYRSARDEPEPEPGPVAPPVPDAPVLNLVASNPQEVDRDDEGPPQWFRELRARESAAATDTGARAASAAPSPAPSGPPPSPGRHSAGTEPPPARTPPPPPPPPTRQHVGGAGRGTPVTEDTLPDIGLISAAWDAFAESDATLQVAVDGSGRTLLHWPPRAETSGASTVYLVCGSATGVPEGPGPSGRLLLTTANQVVLPDDRARYLAVFAYTVGSADDLADAVAIRYAVGRVLLEVQDLRVEPAEHGVLLSWIRPAGVDRVRVLRSLPDQPLPARPDPSLLLRFTGDTFRDSGVEPGATHSYRVYTEAQTLGSQDGSFESSAGLVRTVTVPGRPDAVTDLRAAIELRDGRPGVTVGWTRPGRGTAVIYLETGEPSGDTVLGTAQVQAQWELQEPLLGRRVREPVTRDGDQESIEWMPLDTHADGGRHSQWTITVVTEFSGSWLIGAQAPVLYVGDIDELQIEERVDWQLVRSSWPTGASFLGVWIVAPDGQSHGAPPHSFNRDQFDEHGGVVLALPSEPVDVLVQGYTRYANASIKGGQFRMSYPGRWVVRYDLAAVGRFSSSRRLQLSVDRPGWPNLSFMLIADPAGFPLSTDGPTARELCRGELPATALVPGQLVPAVQEIKIPRDMHTRLLAWTSLGATPIVLDPLAAPSEPPPAPPIPGLRCPRCLRSTDLQVQHFRCQGSCLREPDLPMTELLHPGSADPADVVSDLPVFPWVRPHRVERRTEVLDPPQNAAACPRCSHTSQRHVCPHCHADLPPNWWSYDVLGVVMVGARSSGKTTYVSALISHLERRLLPGIGGHLHPIDPESTTKLKEHRLGVRTGTLAEGTSSAAVQPALLRPMIASIGQRPNGRNRAVALFDVAGEDMSGAETVRPYAPALAGSDLIVILIDPLQLNGIRDWLRGVVPLPPQGDTAATVVNNVVQEIRRLRGQAAGPLPQRAAVVFAKFDGMQTAARTPQSSVSRLIGPGNALWRDPYVTGRQLYLDSDGRRVHDEVRSLLLAMNERTLVNLVESSFQQVRYFALSALGHGPRGRQLTDAGASPQRVGDPLRWLLWSSRWDS
jgi:hypothetical protein